MKLLKTLSVFVAASALLFTMSCEPDESNPCPDAIITIDLDSGSQTYTITAEGLEDLVYSWFLNDNLVETEELDEERDDTFNFRLEPGTYVICIRAESDICEEAIEICEEFTVEAACPEIAFEYGQKEEEGTYVFEIKDDLREGLEGITYTWYIDGDSVFTESGEEREHRFETEFELGTYEVCVTASTDDCDEISYCETIEVEEDEFECPDLHFSVEMPDEERSNLFLFVADFEGKEETSYKWYIGDEVVDKENFEGHETDHELLWDFTPGTYHVCIVVETDRCEEVEFCEEITVEEVCPDLHFTATPDGQFGYLFEADFEGKEDIRYKWIIGDEIVDKENYEGNDTDHELYWQFSPGTYLVCIYHESDLCGGIEFCEEVTIEQSEGCPDLFFEYGKNSDRDYVFEAHFDGIETLEWYGWTINGDIVDEEGTINEGDNRLEYTFEEGTYEVCIITETPDCPEGISFCKEIVVEYETDCVETSYTAERDGEALAYIFTADFEGRDNVTYIWSVYINDDYQGGEVREAGSEDDHNFYWQFEQGVTYEICLKQDGGCVDFQTCEEFVID